MEGRPIAMRDAFLNQICQKMASDDRIFFVSADFGSPVLDKIRAQFPQRFINVGIAEQNLINVSAGLAIEGFKVFSYAIAPFITMRCYEQTRVSLALLSVVRPLNVTLIGVGAGYSYVVSGPTHQCYEDLTLMRAMPNMKVYSPSDHVTAAKFFDLCLLNNGPKYLRLDAQVLPIVYNAEALPDVTRGFHEHRYGDEICLIATGYMVHSAMKVAAKLEAMGFNLGLIDLFNISDFSGDALADALSQYKGVVTMEEGFRGRGGMDAMIFEFFSRREMQHKVLNVGVEGGYRFELGHREQLHEQVGIGVEIVIKKVKKFIQDLNKKQISLKAQRTENEISTDA